MKKKKKKAIVCSFPPGDFAHLIFIPAAQQIAHFL